MKTGGNMDTADCGSFHVYLSGQLMAMLLPQHRYTNNTLRSGMIGQEILPGGKEYKGDLS